MIVAVNYQFHDHEKETFVIDTNKLSGENLFEQDLKKALEGKKKFVSLEGDKYEDDFDYNADAIIKDFPVTIDGTKTIQVFWDC